MSSSGSKKKSSTTKTRSESAKSSKADPVAVIQAELDNLIAKSSSEPTTPPSSKSAISTTAIITATSESTTMSTSSSTPTKVRVSSAGNPTQVITLPPGSPVGKTIQNIVKRSMPSTTSGQVVTKVIITRNLSNKNPTSTAALHQTTGAVTVMTPGSPQRVGGRQLFSQGSPIKLVPISHQVSQQSVVLPKGIMIATSSPGKQTLTKVPIPIMKSPTKSGVSTTPKKIAPAPQTVITCTTPKKIAPQTVIAKTKGSPITLTSVSGVKTIAMANPSAVQQPKSIQIKLAGPQQAHDKPRSTSSVVVTSRAIKGQATPIATATAPAATTVHSVQVPGSKFSYVRLVTVTASGAPSTQTKPAVTTIKAIAPATTSIYTLSKTLSTAQPVKINVPIAPAQKVSVNRSGSSQLITSGTGTIGNRMIMPANTQLKIINPITGETKIASLPPGTTLLAPQGNILQNFAMVPMVSQVVSQGKPTNATNYVSLAPSGAVPQPRQSRVRSPPPPSRAVNGRRSAPVDPDHRPRKPCNCTKSQCLKLYCDCFANGEFCSNCNCNTCFNNLDHEEDRARAIKACLDRNPNAFKPKIGKGRNGELERQHNKGCNCKKSGCLKNYCECYEAKILCSGNCKCVGCKNFEESPERKTLMHLADAAEVRVQQQTDANTKLQSHDFPSKPAIVNDSGKRLPFSFITNDVAEATCQCLLAQAEQTEQRRHTQAMAEKLILEEFGQCLRQVIYSASTTKGVPS